MSLIAMIVAAREAEGAPPGLVAALPVVGRTLVEQQSRIALAAGVDALLLVVERLPPELAAAIERLRDGGLAVHLARSATEAAEMIGPAAELLLIADGLLPAEAALAALMHRPAPALLVLDDAPGMDDWERIDATTRWAGLARLRQADLAATAATLGEWDLELTLVRGIVAAADRVPAPAGSMTPIAGRAAALALGEALADDVPAAALERGVLGWVMARPIEATWLRTGAAALAATGALLAGGGPLWMAAPALLACGPLDRLGRRLAEVRREREALGPGWVRARLAALAAALPLFGWRLSGDAGFEPLLLALAALAFLVAERGEARLHHLIPERWSARPEPMLWLATAFAVAGQGTAGLAALAVWTGASFFRLQRRAEKQS